MQAGSPRSGRLAATDLFLGEVEQCLRAHCPGSPTHARIGAIAFIHRFGAALNAHLHFHCMVIDGLFAPVPTGGVVFDVATVTGQLFCALKSMTKRKRTSLPTTRW